MIFVLCLMYPQPVYAQDDQQQKPASVDTHEYNINLTIRGLKVEQGGIVNVALFVPDDSEEEIVFSPERVFRAIKQPLKNSTTEITFTKIPSGTYAAAVLHDVNNNGKIDYNFFKIPKEAVGFSDNPILLFGVPEFKNAAFDVIDQDVTLYIDMIYFGT